MHNFVFILMNIFKATPVLEIAAVTFLRRHTRKAFLCTNRFIVNAAKKRAFESCAGGDRERPTFACAAAPQRRAFSTQSAPKVESASENENQNTSRNRFAKSLSISDAAVEVIM